MVLIIIFTLVEINQTLTAMKKLLILLLFYPLLITAQQYTDVVDIPGKSSEKLYKGANEWFALTFNSANDVIQLNDPAEKKIIGKGMKQVVYLIKNTPVSLDVFFTLLVQFKDERYKYDLQTNDIRTLGNKTYTFETFKELTTVEGQTQYLKSIGAVPGLIGKRQMQLSADANKMALAEIDLQMHKIIEDLTLSLQKKDTLDNW